MSTEEHDFTIRVESEESWYDGDNYANVTLTFTSDGKSIALEYNSDNGMSKIMPAMLKDIEACIDAPDKWITNAIKQGPKSMEQLREYEQELAEYERDIKSCQQVIEMRSKWRDEHLKKIAEMKERMKP